MGQPDEVNPMSPHDTLDVSGEAPRPPQVGAMPRPLRWGTFQAVLKVVELRLRFVTLMAITGLAFSNSDAIWNTYEKWHRPAVERPVATYGAEFFCPMHPGIVRDEPCGCPSCGMPLARRKKGLPGALPEGVLSRVQLTRGQVSMAGIRTVAATYVPLVATLTTVGEVGYDEGRRAVVASETRRSTRVDELHVDSNGVEVRAGQPLAELDNLDLAQSIRDLHLAHRSARDGSDEHVRLAIDALKLYGVRQSQIDALLKRTFDDYRLPILAPIGGHVVKKNVVQGQYVEEGAVLFEIVDLGHVWIRARVFEDQLAMVRVGHAVTATIPAFPGEAFAGRVSFVAPFLDPDTRTAEVRYSVENPGLLRIGMFVTATFHGLQAETRAVVPSTAILHLHDREWVYTPVENGRFKRLEVVSGRMLANNLQEVVSGLAPGTQVVANALTLQSTVEQ